MLEANLVSVMNREHVLDTFIESVKCSYDYILIDCMPSLGMLTINALIRKIKKDRKRKKAIGYEDLNFRST